VRNDLRCFGSLDWGFNAPGCFLLWIVLPDGHLHIFREFKFQQMTVHEVGAAIKKRLKELDLRLLYLVADPACWQHTGAERGEAIGETLQRVGLPMRKGDNDRKNGWQRIHELLRPAPDGRPWLTIEADPHCKYLRRSLSAAKSDKADPDDIDTKSDDHALDSLRYGAQSRPPIGRGVIQKARNTAWSLGWLKAQNQTPRGPLAPRETRVA
jgi:hypothetical protein